MIFLKFRKVHILLCSLFSQLVGNLQQLFCCCQIVFVDRQTGAVAAGDGSGPVANVCAAVDGSEQSAGCLVLLWCHAGALVCSDGLGLGGVTPPICHVPVPLSSIAVSAQHLEIVHIKC